MGDSIRFSIVVPVYNAAETLGPCLESLVSQEFEDYEVILIDDGSSDSSRSVLIEFCGPTSKLRTIFQDNFGPSAARNAGIALARGDYLVFVDSDDFVEPTMLKELDEALNAAPVDVLFFGMRSHAAGRQSIHFPSDELLAFGRDEFAGAVAQLIESEVFGFQCTKTVRTQLCRRYNISQRTDLRMSEDLVFTMDLVRVANSVGLAPIAPYHYVRRGGSLTLSPASGDLRTQSEVTRLYARFLDDMGVPDASKYKVQRAVNACRSVVNGIEAGSRELTGGEKRGRYRALDQSNVLEILRSDRRNIRASVPGRSSVLLLLCMAPSHWLGLWVFGKLSGLIARVSKNG